MNKPFRSHHQKHKRCLFIIPFLFLAFCSFGQGLIHSWTRTLGGPNWDIANSMVLGLDDDAIISGTFSDSIQINGKWFISKGYADVFVSQFDKDGNARGSFSIGGMGNERALHSVYNGKLVLSISYQNTFPIAESMIDSTGPINVMVAWFGDTGNLERYRTLSSTGKLAVSNMGSDDKGCIFITGSYSDTLRVNGETREISSTGAMFFLVFEDNGKEKRIENLPGMENKTIHASAPDKGNKTLLVGTSDGKEKDPTGRGAVPNTLFTAVMNHGGHISEVKEIIKGMGIRPMSVVKTDNDTWVAAKYLNYCTFDEDTFRSNGLSDILLLKIPDDRSKMKTWSIGGYGDDLPIELRASGKQVVLTGSFSDTIWFDNQQYIAPNALGSDLFMAVYGENTLPLNTVVIGGMHNDFPCAMSTSESGVFVFGQFKDTMQIAGSVFIPKGDYDLFLTKFENCGAMPPLEIFAEIDTSEKGKTNYFLTVDDIFSGYQWSDGLGNSYLAQTDKNKLFTLTATDAYGCKRSGEIDLKILKSAFIDEQEAKLSNALHAKFKLFPTVTSGIVYWQPGCKFPETGATIKIFDMKGRCVTDEKVPNGLHPLSVQVLDVGKLAPGHYLVSITGRGYSEKSKISIKRTW
jgi:hypothetical protein